MTTSAAPEVIRTQCCVVGGGPAGMMLGFLLARAGVDVVVLEKHVDFLRDFRGDTIHPSTLEVMYELGLLDDFLRRPHQEVREVRGVVEGQEFPIGDFTHVPTHCKFLAFMPQWDFLNFLVEHAQKYPTFHLRTQASVTDLIDAGNRIAGVRATTPNGPLEVRADLTIGADGRHSTVRAKAGLTVKELGAPIDVLWMKLTREPTDSLALFGRFDRGRVFVMLFRDQFWQCAFVIKKGGIEEIKAAGLEAFRKAIVEIAPFMALRVHEIRSWDDVKLLSVAVDRLTKWYRPGLLCIGDAAHAMSPMGGVGINLAIQDAVATANLLAEKLRTGLVSLTDLAKVQGRRMLPTRVTQWLQVQGQNNVLSRALATRGPVSPPLLMRLFGRFPFLRRFPARLIGVGIRPEHVHTPDAFAKK